MRSNWYQNILDKYPNAYKECQLYFNIIKPNFDDAQYSDNRYLFDFFDDNKIFISIDYDRGFQYFGGVITNERTEVKEEYWTDLKTTTIRSFIEINAFEIAFEILEKEIRKNTNENNS